MPAMGILRFLLAISVVLAHAEVAWPISGSAAVQVFFVISGFYMALVLDTRYADVWTFWTNRLIRLFPSYLLMVALTAILVRNYAPFWETFGVFDAITNLAIVGQDVATFQSPRGALLVPQAWSLALELYFYALAPFIVRLRTLTLLAIIAASFAARLIAYSYGLDHDPWTYRFFPFEIAFFLCGILAYRSGLVPLSNWDKFIGDLSYPIYINHLLLSHVFRSPLTLVIASVVLAAIMVIFIENPLERLRSRRLHTAKLIPSTPLSEQMKTEPRHKLVGRLPH